METEHLGFRRALIPGFEHLLQCDRDQVAYSLRREHWWNHCHNCTKTALLSFVHLTSLSDTLWRNMRVCQVASVVSASLWPCGLQPPRLLCPWDSPGKNPGVSCHVLLQEIFPTQGSNLCILCFLHCRWITPESPEKPQEGNILSHKLIIELNKIYQIDFTCSFLLLMWLPENTKLHMCLALYYCWTALNYVFRDSKSMYIIKPLPPQTSWYLTYIINCIYLFPT